MSVEITGRYTGKLGTELRHGPSGALLRTAAPLDNQGDGSFTNMTVRAGVVGEARSHSATWWDFDHDGWPDLYVAYDYGVPDTLYHNNRDGTFTDTAGKFLPHTSFSSMGADLGDVNNNGLIDFLVADMAPTTHEKDQRGMADQRSRAIPLPDNAPTAPNAQNCP